jgi:murein DD-endopeptidase MepM/ murein hydrolase activator NlpD
MNALRLFIALACGIQLVMLARTPARDQAAVLEVPLSGDVVVIQGGLSPLVNHHYFASGQRDAVDLAVAENGTFRRPDATGLDAIPCFGAPILAPAAGTVVTVSDGLPDAPLGQADTAHVAGNHLVIDLGASRYLVMAHLRQGSARVRPGDRVEPGTIVAACGNSGNTSEPHLHIQVQDRPTFPSEARTIPLLFRSRRANGEVLVAPRRADHLRRSDLRAPGL